MVQSPVSSFHDYACQVRAEIDDALDGYSAFDENCPVALRDAIRHSLLSPGKRLRPLLVLMSAEACGCLRGRALPAACAVEMVHTYSLIHDDLPSMDDDDLRRGNPTCHVKYGEATAILAGDALLANAFERLASQEPPEIAARCCHELAAAAGASALVGGQIDDLANEFSEGGIEQLERIHRRKTGAMFCVAVRLGGLVGEATDEQLALLDSYGRSLGLAFQITDDLLDVKGDAAVVGKRTEKDTGRGKLTFPMLLGIEESLRRAEELIDIACAASVQLGSGATHLESLARFVLERDR
jgi:geranylgeranyl diphosphate synthase type II